MNETYQLIGHVGVVISRHAVTDGWLHEPRQRRQHVDWWINLPTTTHTSTTSESLC